MKYKFFFFLLLGSLLIGSCSVDNCNVDCNSGPLSLNFQFLDKATSENLFTNGTFDRADIRVLDIDDNNRRVAFTFHAGEAGDIISLGPFGWGTNVANYLIKIGERNIFTLHIDAEQQTKDCCSFVQINELEIKNTEFSKNPETGIYEILVEL